MHCFYGAMEHRTPPGASGVVDGAHFSEVIQLGLTNIYLNYILIFQLCLDRSSWFDQY